MQTRRTRPACEIMPKQVDRSENPLDAEPSARNDEERSARRDAEKPSTNALRRALLLWTPYAIFAAVAGSFATTAYKFLRPQANVSDVAADSKSGEWVAIAQLSALSDDQPSFQTPSVEKRAGWSVEREERPVYVLPGAERRVVSAICPHERCTVTWNASANLFECPCHDSSFNADGEFLSGPAESDLAKLPARVESGTLQVRLDA